MPQPPTSLKHERETRRSNSLIDRTWNLLKSMKFAIVLLLVIAAASIFNLFANEFIIPVHGSPDQAHAMYVQAYGNFRADLLSIFQMYSPYRSWWYTLMLGLLMLSLLVCVIDRAPKVYRLTFRPHYLPNRDQYAEMNHHSELRGGGLKDHLVSLLRKQGYTVHQKQVEGHTLIDGERFPWAQSGSWLVHIGFILLVLGGAMIARGGYSISVGGLPGDMLEPPGDNWGFNVRVDDFEIHYHPLGEGQYVMVDGNTIGRIVAENEDGTFDVDTYSPARGRLTHVPAARLANKIERRMQGGRLDQMNISDYVATLSVIQNGKVVKTATVEVNKPMRYHGYRFYQASFDDTQTDAAGHWTTILNVRKDRGAPFVWAGILIVSIGLIMGMYFEPVRVLALAEGDGTDEHLFVAGRTERNRSLFGSRFESLMKRLRESTKGAKEVA